jgi:phosphoglycerate dehydrogenase-like enzyme
MTVRWETAEREREAEAVLVLRWRFEVLFRAGYSRNQAILLAREGVDLHRATALLERGCPVATALEILL